MKKIYVVSEGENLLCIANKFGVSPMEILARNKVSESNIQCGTVLVIDKIDGERYVVKPFDTIESIAQKYNKSARDIAMFNNVKQVFLGEVIYIPNI